MMQQQRQEDFLAMLHEQHMKVQQEIMQMQNMPMNEHDRKKDVWRQFKHDITAHMDGEEKYWYPVLERNQNSRMDAQMAMEEHKAAREVFKDLDDTDMDDSRWMARLMVLQELLTSHIKEEEEKLFPETRQGIGDRQTMEIMNDFKKEQEHHRGILDRIMGS